MCLSAARVHVLRAGGAGEDSGDLARRLEQEWAGRREDLPAAVVERIAGREATLTASSVSDSESRSCLPVLATVSVIFVMFRCEKCSNK